MAAPPPRQRAHPKELGGLLACRLAGGFAALLAAWTPAALADADTAAEYRVKAAFLVNFARFTEWPERPGDNLTICVYGEDPFGTSLDGLAGQAVGRRHVRVRRVASVDGLTDCQLVFVSRPSIGNLPRVLDTVGSAPVLIVADSPGAMLNMDSYQGRITFSSNLAAARRQGLNLSAKLLSLATAVYQ